MPDPDRIPPEHRCRKCGGWGGVRVCILWRMRDCPRCRGTGRDPEPLEHVPRVSPPPPPPKKP